MSEFATTTAIEESGAGRGSGVRPTRLLLAFGVVAGPLFMLVSLTQALTREGFDLTRHAGSLLANGDLGWIQVTIFVVTGMMLIAGAAGIRRALGGGRWGPRLLAIYGVGLIGAGLFTADPTFGFPAGTPDGPGAVSWHGLLHLILGSLAFLAFIVACLVIARRFAARGERAWAVYSRITGVVFLAGFVGIASGSGSANPLVVVGFLLAGAVGWMWISTLRAHLYRQTT